jgi:hypothetical protein
VRPRLVILVCGGRIESSARLNRVVHGGRAVLPTTEFGIPQPAALWWSGDGWSLHQRAIDDSGAELGIANQTLAQPGKDHWPVSGRTVAFPSKGEPALARFALTPAAPSIEIHQSRPRCCI